MNTKHRILVADDDTRGLHFLNGLLSSEGYDLCCVTDGPQALAQAAEATPDAILLDVMMPGMNGFEVCRRLRAHPVLSQIPIILLTALDDRDSRLEGLEAGADDFLTKPFDATELLIRLRTITRLNRFRRLAEERTRFEQIVAFSPEGIVIATRQGEILMCNREFARLGALAEPAEAVGQNILDWIVGDGRDKLCALLEQGAESAKGRVLELSISGDPDTEAIPVELGASGIPWEGRQEVQLVLRDVQEKRRLEGQVMHYQRVELLGEMAGSIVHDINNVFSAIGGNLSLLDMHNTLDADSRDRIAMMQQTITRGAGILRQLLCFTRGSDGDLAPVDLRDLVGEVVGLLRPMMKGQCEIRCSMEQEIQAVEADSNQVHQILMNLCVNARDAMPEGGAISIEVTQCTLSEEQARSLDAHAKPGPHVCIRVTDTGTGMPPEVMARIFSPFFTTKPQGKGTGLGLATVLRLVHRHGGFITVESEQGKGTSFQCHFPALPLEGGAGART